MRSPWTAHPTLIAISCAGGRDTFTISTIQRLSDPSATLKIDVAIGDAPLGIALPRSAATLKLWKGDPYDVRQAKFPSAVIEKLLTATSVAVKETPSTAAAESNDGAARKPSAAQYWISTTGGKRAFEALSDQCAILN